MSSTSSNSISHKRSYSSSGVPNGAQLEELRTPRFGHPIKDSSNFILTNSSNTGLSVNSAYGFKDRRLSNSSSCMDFENLSIPLNNKIGVDRRLSNEELIDVMEKEQDAIVLKLMREIKMLKEENSYLRNKLKTNQLISEFPRSKRPRDRIVPQ